MVESGVSSDRTVLLVEDGSGITALAAARELAAAGWTVAVGCPGGRSPATVSRSCRRSGPLPVLQRGQEQAWVTAVHALGARTGAAVVVPCGDAELLTLSATRTQGHPLVLPYPGDEVVRRLLDKHWLSAAAREVGLATPHTELAEPGQPPSFAGPVVVKPRWHGPSPSGERIEALVARDSVAALSRAHVLQSAGVEVLYQQHVTGDLVAHVVVRGRDGRTLTRLHQVAQRTYPVPAGNCVRGAVQEAPAALVEKVDRLLADARWWGLVQLELLRSSDGVLHLVDANPRPYGTMALAARAGLAPTQLWLTDALGQAVSAAVPVARTVSYQALGLDLRRAVQQRSPSLATDLRETLSAGRARPARPVWDVRDQRPFWLQARRVAGRVTRRLSPWRPAAPAPP